MPILLSVVKILFAGKEACEHKIFNSLGLAPSVNIPNNPPPPKDGNVTKNLFGLANLAWYLPVLLIHLRY